MTEDEFVKRVGRANVLSEVEIRALDEKVMNGELVRLGGPTQVSYDFAKNPTKEPVTREMIETAHRKCGL